MSVPDLKDFPQGPDGKTGWPWDKKTTLFPDKMPGGTPWPRLTVVTPSFNQGSFLEETIRSVLLQGYPDLEYIIIDGESSDNSIEIIKKYEPWISHWRSKKDKGQADAINKGFSIANGSIFVWLNSDDLFLENACYLAVSYLAENSSAGMVFGDRIIIDTMSCRSGERCCYKYVPWQFRYCSGINQETAFFRKSIFDDCGKLDTALDFAMDLDLWFRIDKFSEIHYLPVFLGAYRSHKDSKSVKIKSSTNTMNPAELKMAEETAALRKKYFGRASTALEMFLLPRIHAILKRLEKLTPGYRRKKTFIKNMIHLLNKQLP